MGWARARGSTNKHEVPRSNNGGQLPPSCPAWECPQPAKGRDYNSFKQFFLDWPAEDRRKDLAGWAGKCLIKEFIL